MHNIVRIVSAVIAATGFPGSAAAQTGADFYKGKTVTYIVATAPGGGYDLYGRLTADTCRGTFRARPSW